MALAIAAVLAASLCHGDKRITSKKDREAAVNVAEKLLQMTSAEPEGFATSRNPFFMQSIQAPVIEKPVEQKKDDPEPVVVRKERMPETDALKEIARRVRASGSIIRGERRILMLSSGAWINPGHVFTEVIDGLKYEALLSQVNASSYTLRMGKTEVRIRF